MLTRSVRNVPHLDSALEDLRLCCERWRKRAARNTNHSWHDVHDWVGVLEIKRGHLPIPYSRRILGWNVHEHLLICSTKSELDYSQWQSDWKAAAGDPAAHLDLTLSTVNASAYLMKYMVKGGRSRVWGGMRQDTARRYSASLKGKRHLRRKRGSAPPSTNLGWTQCCKPAETGICEEDQMWADALVHQSDP